MYTQDLTGNLNRFVSTRFSICLICLLVCTVGLFSTVETSAQECQTTSLSSSLAALSWPALLAQDQSLLAIDGIDRQVVKITLSGNQAGIVQRRVLDQARSFRPVGTDIVQVFGEGKKLRVGWYDQQLKLRDSLSFGEKEVKLASRRLDRRHVLAPHRWIVVQGHLVGYGTVSTNSEGSDFESGFFDQPLPTPGSNRIPPANLFHPFGNPSFYLIGNPLIVGIESEVYYLELGKYASLYQFDLALGLPPELIEGLPGGNTPLKDPKTHQLGRKGHDLLMQRLDEYEGPWGLYEQQGALHLLTRKLNGTSPEWRLRKLEIEDNQINQSVAKGVVLKSRAQQLALVPTSTDGKWLIFEQTRDRDGTRKISTMKTCQNLTLGVGQPGGS